LTGKKKLQGRGDLGLNNVRGKRAALYWRMSAFGGKPNIDLPLRNVR
jgi:hypothetical protein